MENTILNIAGLVVERVGVVFMISAFVLAFTIFNFKNLRKCYFDIRNKKLFFMLNFLSNIIFACVNFVVLIFAKNEVYTWLFSITKGLKFLDIDVIYSILLFHFVQLICIIVSPIGMGWIFDKNDEPDAFGSTYSKDVILPPTVISPLSRLSLLRFNPSPLTSKIPFDV